MDSEASRIYLDNAATSWPKHPGAVREAMEFITNCGATAGRGTYASSRIADRWVQDARRNVARLINAPRSTDMALCANGTHALNAALWGILRNGDHVITTASEHNSVLRPLEMLRSQRDIEYDVIPVDQQGRASAQAAAQFVRPTTRALCIGHASNVTGSVLDLTAWRELANNTEALLIVDASQTLGYIPIDVLEPQIDVLAAAAHKGLRALHGTGILYVQQSHQSALLPLLSGGTGHQSEQISGGQDWPNSIEAGNLNMPGIVSIAVAAEALVKSPDAVSSWQMSFQRLVSGLRRIAGVTIVGYDNEDRAEAIAAPNRIPVISIRTEGWSPHDLASILSDVHNIEARAGLHCAALVHNSLGTMADGGTLRLSPGHSTSHDDVDRALGAIEEILSSGS